MTSSMRAAGTPGELSEFGTQNFLASGEGVLNENSQIAAKFGRVLMIFSELHFSRSNLLGELAHWFYPPGLEKCSLIVCIK